MKLPRRQFLHLAAGAAALPAVARIARAQTYPSRPVRMIVGYAPAGAGDISTRLMGQWLSERLGQQFIVENRPGAGTNIATEAVVKAAQDGYTLLMSSAANAINATLYERLNFNFIRDLTPIAGIMRVPHVIVVHPSFSATDLLSGQLQAYVGAMTSSLEYVKAGSLRALAVTTATRSEALPEISTVSDFVPGFETSDWGGVSGPKGTPVEIIDRLNKEINAGLADPKIKARFADLGATVIPGSPADFGKLIAEETEKWAKVVKFSGAKPD
jgi:tripartite-type tricarboxylate transporter receptor subunit TctC